MTELMITVPGHSRGKGRPKFSRRGAFVKAYTPEQTVSAENWVKSCAVDQVGSPLLGGALWVQINVFLMIPESWSKKKKALCSSGELRPIGKPDVDNYAKLVMDSLNEIVWRDDSQIVQLEASKFYSDCPQTVIIVRTITPPSEMRDAPNNCPLPKFIGGQGVAAGDTCQSGAPALAAKR
jgi:Holliday junction resolvase RusA-like endonuclease